ncbi:hypothetical protein DE146DRAFT_736234 [Phaeosphaeria sp. MPI-PUGE-AT-0046c]|nr:hypothetical protein DE146DRAFT_736234 [Phaeosphaeria sp. MPI-PUGE-AT-0046c]
MMLLSFILTVASIMSTTSCAAIPNGCTASYSVVSGDSCTSIVNKFQNFTATDLYRWNPEIAVQCWGLAAGSPVCINLPPNTPGTPFKAGDIFAASYPPVPQQFEIISGCKYFEYTNSKGLPGLRQILRGNNITLQQWNEWNWTIDKTQYNIVWADYFSCVAV